MGIAMINDLSVLHWASAMARHAAQRHQVISENVANADTPSYRARDVENFATLVNDGFTPRATRAGHVDGGTGAGRARVVELDLPWTPNGNSVDLEDQVLRAVETESQHRLAMSVYGKTLEIVRLGLGRIGR